MTDIIITAHAAARYVERIGHAMSPEQAGEAILASARAIRAAHAFGCRCVITAAGARLIVGTSDAGEPVIVTVKHADNYKPSVPRKFIRRFGRVGKVRLGAGGVV